MNPIKILYAIELLEVGAARHLVDLATHVDPQKFQVRVLTSACYSGPEIDLKIKRLNSRNILTDRLPFKLSSHPWSIIYAIRLLMKYIRENRPDIIHVHSSRAGVLMRIAGWLCGVTIIYTPHCFYFHTHSGVKKYFYLYAEKILSALTDRIIISENEYIHAERVCGKNSAKINICNNVVDPSVYKRYERSIACAELGLTDSDLIIGGVGRLARQKGWDTFIMAAARIIKDIPQKKITFFIAGDGPERQRLVKLIESEGIEHKFHLLGHVEDISKVFSCMDIFVSSSLWEGLPYSYLEAELFGIPMIVSHTCCIEKVLPEGSIGYPSTDIDDLVGQLKDLFATKKYTSNEPLPSSGIKFDRFISNHQKFYEQVARGPYS